MTFNEPVGYCLNAYFQKKYPPYKKNLRLAGEVIKNMLDAHTAVYHKFKEKDKNAQIGFAKIIVPLDPYRSWHPFDNAASSKFDYLQNYTILNYFTTGKFTWGILPVPKFASQYARFTAENKEAIGALDFLAINYYYNVMLQGMTKKTVPGRDTWGKENDKCIYPEGLYRAVKNVAKYLPDTPLIIGENGIETENPELRKKYIKQHFFVVNKLIKNGYNVEAYHWWSLFDTYSWSKGGFSPYGFYKVDPKNYARTLRENEGFKDFINLIRTGSYKDKPNLIQN